MIRRIQRITAFGVFADFTWAPDLPEFKQYNLLYGWNYSGKTTLSRIFRCYELGVNHQDFASAEVIIETADGTIHHLSAPQTAPKIVVFNPDFVRENLIFADGSATPILVLGKEDIAKQELLKAKNAERDALNVSIETNSRTIAEKRAEIEKALTRYARDFIKNQLAEVNYDKRRFEPIVDRSKAAPEQYLLDAEGFAEALSVYRATEKKPPLARKESKLLSVAALREKAASLLSRVVTASTPIVRLKDEPAIERWVNQGRDLHRGKETCQFCEQPLPSDLFDRLKGHFSADYENLMSELEALRSGIEGAMNEGIQLDHKNDFYSELSDQFSKEENTLGTALSVRRAALERLDEAVVAKRVKAFSEVECPLIEDPAPVIAGSLAEINKLIEDHNQRTLAFETKRAEAFGRLEKHYAGLFVRDENYNETLKEIEDLGILMSDQAKTRSNLNGEILRLEEEISEAAKGAGRVNELIKAYFGKDDLNIVVSPEKRFQIVRNGVVAKNLSEGEKTAIAFAYFITRVQDGRRPLADTTVVIDDPISSLDANHLFNTYALIKTQLAGCRQLFISTHSFEFFNLLREWVADDEKDIKRPQEEWKKWGVYLVKRTDEGNAVLDAIPKELLRFRSEYHYLFATLYHFEKASDGNFDSLLSLPNVVRRFMEAFGGIMIPLSTGLKGKMERIFPDEVVRERVWKFINHYSHNATITRSLTIPDTSECKAVVRACLKAVLDWDADYFKDLEFEVQ